MTTPNSTATTSIPDLVGNIWSKMAQVITARTAPRMMEITAE